MSKTSNYIQFKIQLFLHINFNIIFMTSYAARFKQPSRHQRNILIFSKPKKIFFQQMS